MWYPTRTQWIIIWATTVLCLIGFLANDAQPEAFIPPAMLVAGLFLWQASTDFRRGKE